MNRRDFLKLTGIQAGALAAGADPLAGVLDPRPGAREAPTPVTRRPEVLVVGAGAFGVWTAFYLQELGVDVLLVDQYGPGNSRSTSGGETRGVRTGYRDREVWTRWASRAVERWRELDRRWTEEHGIRLYFPTGDLTLRPDRDPFTTETRETWEKVGVEHEVLTADEVAYRWPWIAADEVGVALYEYDAGVVQARKVCQQVAGEFTGRLGGELRIARAEPGRTFDGRLVDVLLHPRAERLEADRYVFALGPWFGKVFPEVMADRIRTPLGHTYYFGVPPGDDRFRHPRMPSYNLPGVTGWPALPPDSRGFRVRTGGRRPEDPDESMRYVPEEHLERPREVLETWFPDLADAPLIETRACHYEVTPDRNWLVDRHPEMRNVWLFGGGNAEGFKFGPVLGEYMARRVLGEDPHPELADELRLSEDTFGGESG